MPTETYRCAYCGTQQTWDGTGVRTCSHCGATQPEQPADAPVTPPARSPLRLVLVLVLLGLLGLAGYLIKPKQPKPTAKPYAAPIVDGSGPNASRASNAGRIEKVLNPQIRVLPAGSDYSLLDLLRSAPNSSAAMFDTRLLTVSQPRPMNDIDGKLYFVGEVVNHSTDTTAIAPTVGMTLFKGGRKLESTDLEFSDLPPGAHSPAYFTWDGGPRDIDRFQFHWKPVQSYPAGASGHPQLQTTITNKKLTPGTVEVNFTSTYHFVTADVEGTVTNRGSSTATGIQLYLTLRDAQGRVTGFKEQDLQQIAPGQSVEYKISADQWDGPVASLDVAALPVSEPVF